MEKSPRLTASFYPVFSRSGPVEYNLPHADRELYQLNKQSQTPHQSIDSRHVHELMTEQEAAAYLGVSISGMRKWRARGFGPAYCRFGKIIRYRKSSLDEFADLHTSSNKGPRNQPLSIEEQE